MCDWRYLVADKLRGMLPLKRDPAFPLSYWDEQVAYLEQRIVFQWKGSRSEDVDQNYLPQYVFDIAMNYLSLMLSSYSRGDAVEGISRYFEGFLDAWEEANRLGRDVWSEEGKRSRNSWRESLDAYNIAFNVAGIAILLGVPDEYWFRLVELLGNEGQDELLDKVIASRQPGRRIGSGVSHPKAYQALLNVIDASESRRSELLLAYVDGWFASLENAGPRELPPSFRTPWWWISCVDEQLGKTGGYVGCWCIEAAVVAKIFGIDDSQLVQQPHYPADLLNDGRSPRYSSPRDQPRKVLRRGLLAGLRRFFD